MADIINLDDYREPLALRLFAYVFAIPITLADCLAGVTIIAGIPVLILSPALLVAITAEYGQEGLLISLMGAAGLVVFSFLMSMISDTLIGGMVIRRAAVCGFIQMFILFVAALFAIS